MLSDLPFIDEWQQDVEAPADQAFDSVARRIGLGFDGWLPSFFTRLLGCVNHGTSYRVPPLVGQEANGFRVERVDAPRELILEGQHRFASYRLSFFVEPVAGGRSRVRARTDALFPGVKGTFYRLLVITSRAHRIIVKRMLARIAESAERSSIAP